MLRLRSSVLLLFLCASCGHASAVFTPYSTQQYAARTKVAQVLHIKPVANTRYAEIGRLCTNPSAPVEPGFFETLRLARQNAVLWMTVVAGEYGADAIVLLPDNLWCAVLIRFE